MRFFSPVKRGPLHYQILCSLSYPSAIPEALRPPDLTRVAHVSSLTPTPVHMSLPLERLLFSCHHHRSAPESAFHLPNPDITKSRNPEPPKRISPLPPAAAITFADIDCQPEVTKDRGCSPSVFPTSGQSLALGH